MVAHDGVLTFGVGVLSRDKTLYNWLQFHSCLNKC
jgi:hypothetical protein